MSEQQAILVIDLAYGDSGKGTIVDFLTRRCDSPAIVRFNGGPQAAHNVVMPDGRHHTFSQFGSGTFVPGVRTFLSEWMLIEPYALLNEARHLESVGVADPMSRLWIDRQCPVITPLHQAANQIRELARGDGRHGTCGMGIGELMQDRINTPELILHAFELNDAATIKRKLLAMREAKLSSMQQAMDQLKDHPRAAFALQTLKTPTWLDAAVENYQIVSSASQIVDTGAMYCKLRESNTLIFEGAQGVLLDETHGFGPHTTWSTTTFVNAQEILDQMAFSGRRSRIGVLRTYFTRHGAGPFVTEHESLRARLPEPHNADSGWQGGFRVGVFDAVAARYAISAAGHVDTLAVTHVDRLSKLPAVLCDRYTNGIGRDLPRLPGSELTRLIRGAAPVLSAVSNDSPEWQARIAEELATPVHFTSFGPTATEKRVTANLGLRSPANLPIFKP